MGVAHYKMRSRRVREDDAIRKQFASSYQVTDSLRVSVNAVTIAPGQCPPCRAAFSVNVNVGDQPQGKWDLPVILRCGEPQRQCT